MNPRNLMPSGRLAVPLKLIFTGVLIIAALVVAYGSGYDSSFRSGNVRAVFLLLPVAIFVVGIRSAAGTIVVGILLMILDYRTWTVLQAEVGPEEGLGVGLILVLLAAIGIGGTLIASGLDWAARHLGRLFRDSKT